MVNDIIIHSNEGNYSWLTWHCLLILLTLPNRSLNHKNPNLSCKGSGLIQNINRKNCFLNVVSKSLRQYYLMIHNIFNKCLNFHSKKLYKQISNGIYYLIFWWFDSDIGNHKWFSYLDNWINVDEIQTLDLMRFNSVWTFHLW